MGLLIAAVLAAVLIVIGLYAWDTSARAAETALRPVPVAPLALGLPTPTPRVAVASPPAAAARPRVAVPSPSTQAAGLPVAVVSPSAQAAGPPVAVASPADAASTSGTSGDPVAGARTFMSTCNVCHPGANAGVGPALHGPQFDQRYPEDGPLLAVMRQGKGGMPSMMKGMPGGQGQLSDQDAANVLAYLRGLSSGAIAP